jgi:large subunit ribosomal protein L18e
MKVKTTNPETQSLINFLQVQARKNKIKIWRTLANYLIKSKRSRIAVNIGKLVRLTSEGENVVVPGKVLGSGLIDHKIFIAASNFSPRARNKIEVAGGKCMDFYELVKKNPKGSNIKIIR